MGQLTSMPNLVTLGWWEVGPKKFRDTYYTYTKHQANGQLLAGPMGQQEPESSPIAAFHNMQNIFLFINHIIRLKCNIPKSKWFILPRHTILNMTLLSNFYTNVSARPSSCRACRNPMSLLYVLLLGMVCPTSARLCYSCSSFTRNMTCPGHALVVNVSQDYHCVSWSFDNGSIFRQTFLIKAARWLPYTCTNYLYVALSGWRTYQHWAEKGSL